MVSLSFVSYVKLLIFAENRASFSYDAISLTWAGPYNNTPSHRRTGRCDLFGTQCQCSSNACSESWRKTAPRIQKYVHLSIVPGIKQLNFTFLCWCFPLFRTNGLTLTLTQDLKGVRSRNPTNTPAHNITPLRTIVPHMMKSSDEKGLPRICYPYCGRDKYERGNNSWVVFRWYGGKVFNQC